jgi:YVTN family beta-propeller protein
MGMTYDATTGNVYVTNYLAYPGTVSVINATLDSVLATVTVGNDPYGTAWDSANGDVYVSDFNNTNPGNVSIIAGSNNSVIRTLPAGWGPAGIAFDNTRGRVFVANWNSNNVTVINGSTNRVAGSVDVGAGPEGVAFDYLNGFLYVANSQSDNLTVINGSSDAVVGWIRLTTNTEPSSIAFDSSNGLLYVTESNGGSIAIVNGAKNSFVGSIYVNQYSVDDLVDPANGLLYVLVGSNSEVIVLATANESVLGSIPVGLYPDGSAYDAANGHVFISSSSDNIVTVLQGGPITLASFSAAPSPVRVNQTTALNASVWEPAGGLRFAYTGLPAGCSSLNVTPLECTPSAAGTFAVRVYVNDSAGDSTYADLSLGVYPLLSITSFTADPNPVVWGEGTTLIVSPSGGVLPEYITFEPETLGCLFDSLTSRLCAPPSVGSFLVSVYVNDSANETASSHLTLTVLPAPLVLTAEATPNRTDADVPVQFVSQTSGGTGVNTYSWEFGDGASSSAQNASHSYSRAGSYLARTWVNDSAGISVSFNVSVFIDPALSLSASVSNATPFLGRSIVINATASGGDPPYGFAYTGLPPGCVSVNVSTIGCLPTQAGLYNVTAEVADGNHVGASVAISLHIIFDFTVVAPAQVTVNQPLDVVVNVAEGYGTLTYLYDGLPPGCASVDAPQLACIPTQVGTYPISVSVRDQAGDNATRQVTVTVVHAGSSFLNSPLVLYGLVAAIAVAAVAVLALLIVLHRHRGPRPPAPAPPAS